MVNGCVFRLLCYNRPVCEEAEKQYFWKDDCMAVTTCWNCRNPVSGAVCPTCGAQQTSNIPTQMPSYAQNAPTHLSVNPQNAPTQISANPQNMPTQPSVGQASASYRQQPMYVPGGQPGVRNYVAQNAITPTYGPGAQPPASTSPLSGPAQPYGAPAQQYGAPGAGWQQPGAMPGQPMGMQAGMRAPAASSGMGQQVAMAAIYGVVASIVGALIWAFFLNITKLNISYLAIGLGFLVGLGVLMGSRGQRHVVFMVLAGVLGLLSFVLALYFRLSLRDFSSLFGLPFSFFSDDLKGYLSDNPINYIYFVAVPLTAILTTVGRTAQRVRRR
jgi:hypothetical protein